MGSQYRTVKVVRAGSYYESGDRFIQRNRPNGECQDTRPDPHAPLRMGMARVQTAHAIHSAIRTTDATGLSSPCGPGPDAGRATRPADLKDCGPITQLGVNNTHIGARWPCTWNFFVVVWLGSFTLDFTCAFDLTCDKYLSSSTLQQLL
jgi:hypothetical protein